MESVQDKTFWLRYLDACNQKDIELADRLTDQYMTEDCVWHMPGWPEQEMGSEGQKKFMRETIASNPDFGVTVDDLLFDGDKMILRGMIQMNNPTTGAVESQVFLEIDRLVDGKIAESWSLFVPGQW